MLVRLEWLQEGRTLKEIKGTEAHFIATEENL